MNTIPFITPRQGTTEATLQAEIYHQLRKKNIKSVLEYKINNCITDIAVLDSTENICCAIEVKRNRKREVKRTSKQYNKYEKLGIPFIYCVHESRIKDTVDLIQRYINKEKDLPSETVFENKSIQEKSKLKGSLEKMKNSKIIETNQALTPKAVTRDDSGIGATWLARVTDCKFIVMENGNVLPMLYFYPVYIAGKRRNCGLISTWKLFDDIGPRIGGRVLLLERYNYMELASAGVRRGRAGVMERPKTCPLCNAPLWYNESGTMARCTNEKCDINDIRRIYRYYVYGCKVGPKLYFSQVYTMYTLKLIRTIDDIYNLTAEDYMKAYISEELANKIVECVNKNKTIPIHILYYSILGTTTPIRAIQLSSMVTGSNQWMEPIPKLTKTEHVSEEMAKAKNPETSELLQALNILNDELNTHAVEYKQLAKRIVVTQLPAKLPLVDKTIALLELSTVGKQYAETAIKLNSGKPKINLTNIIRHGIHYTIANDNVNKKENDKDIPMLSEDELYKLL